MFPMNVLAVENTSRTENIIYLDDGGYITVQTELILVRATQTKSAKRTYTYHANSGDEEWKAVLTGTFTYTGTTSTCTSSSCTVSITNTNWYEVSKTVGKSGNKATADLIMGRKFLGITIKKETINMTLTCDANGNLS
jgi:hypothetical protein